MRFTRIAFAATAAALALVGTVPARAGSDVLAPSATQDIAQPYWAATSISSYNTGVDCSHSSFNVYWPSGCRIRVVTPTSGAGCVNEKIGNPSYPSVYFQNTTCTGWIDGKLSMEKVNGVCDLTTVNSLSWSFNSGVASIYNGSFTTIGGIGNNVASATAKNIDASGNKYSLVISGGGVADAGSPATAGTIYVPFQLTFSPRLPVGACPSADLMSKGTVTSVLSDVDNLPIGQIQMTS